LLTVRQPAACRRRSGGGSPATCANLGAVYTTREPVLSRRFRGTATAPSPPTDEESRSFGPWRARPPAPWPSTDNSSASHPPASHAASRGRSPAPSPVRSTAYDPGRGEPSPTPSGPPAQTAHATATVA